MKTSRALGISAPIILLALGGCRIGPKYNPPATPAPPAFKESSPAAYKNTLPGAWQPARPQDAELKGKWWEIFREPELNALEEQLNINNQNIAQYFQNFMAARAQVNEVRSQYFPTVTADPSITRSRIGGGSSGLVANNAASGIGTAAVAPSRSAVTYTGITLPIDVSWEPDLWGRVRNTVREYRNAAQVSAADLENERLTRTGRSGRLLFRASRAGRAAGSIQPHHRSR
jgi:outer membrane protein TolC